MHTDWFTTSKEGLARMAREQGAARVVVELIANALDEAGVQQITMTARPDKEDSSVTRIVVTDDGEQGFLDLAHAYTVFAESYKRANPEQRGRFNLGEKLFLSLCRAASVTSTKGRVNFDGRGRGLDRQVRRKRGTKVEATVELAAAERAELDALVRRLIVPTGVEVVYNGRPVEARSPIHTFEAVLATKIADEAGVLRFTSRKTRVSLYEPHDGEAATIYELGIPVVETDIRWHVDVGQKVPLGKDRDNVTPAYRRRLVTIVAEEMHESLTSEDAAGWADSALADPEASDEVIRKLVNERFGEKHVNFDPSDPEANVQAAAAGATVIHGGTLTSTQWRNVRRAEASAPAGREYGTPRPYSDTVPSLFDQGNVVDEEEWSEGMRRVADYARWLAQELCSVRLNVVFVRKMDNRSIAACYACRGDRDGLLEFNLRRLGRKWFEQGINEQVDALLIHELGHHQAGNHFSDEYFDELCRIGAGLKRLALTQPERFTEFMAGPQPTGK